jgi:lipoate-protein ligase A
MVRRQSGGGAILHDQEWTYSLTLGRARLLPSRLDASLYLDVHDALKAALAEWAIATRICDASGDTPSNVQPFLCFERRCARDLLLGDWKILGSAQRRRRGALLQHGSLLLRASPAAPELPGVLDLAQREIDPDELLAAWQEHLAARLGFAFQRARLSQEELSSAAALQRDKYAVNAWNQRR